MNQITIKSLKTINKVALKILSAYRNYKIFAFYGQIGAGKTTIIKALCNQLGATSVVNSPSFVIINEYDTLQYKKIYHIDFYRLKNIYELQELGCQEIFYSNNYCFIEWPQIAEKLLPDNYIKIYIDVLPNGWRNVTITTN